MELPAGVQNGLWNWMAELNIAAERTKLWAVVLRLVPFKDGNQWCVLYGDNLQEGICAFGDTPEKALEAFDAAMREDLRVTKSQIVT